MTEGIMRCVLTLHIHWFSGGCVVGRGTDHKVLPGVTGILPIKLSEYNLIILTYCKQVLEAFRPLMGKGSSTTKRTCLVV